MTRPWHRCACSSRSWQGSSSRACTVGQQTVDAIVGVLDAHGRSVDVLHDVVWRHRGKRIAPKTLNQKRYVDAIRSSTVTFGVGPAGTGKTYLAMALAVSALVDREVARIILTRPAVEAGERLGFLPGDMLAKVDPYLRPLFDALYDMLDADRLTAYMEKGMIEVAPLAFMRGRTLNDSFIILDEAQNTTPEQMQMFLTRLGFGSKIVVTGDPTQNDLARGERSGLADVSEVLPGIPGIEFVNFGSEDVVRHKLVQRIVSAYKERAEQRDAVGEVTPASLDLTVEGADASTGSTRRALRDLAVALLDGRGRRRPVRARHRVRRRGAHARAQLPSTAGSTRSPTCSRSRSTASTSCRRGSSASSATSSSASRRPSGRPPRPASRRCAEMRTLVVHGLLHLLGHDHEIDAGEMLARQDELSAVLPRSRDARVTVRHGHVTRRAPTVAACNPFPARPRPCRSAAACGPRARRSSRGRTGRCRPSTWPTDGR